MLFALLLPLLAAAAQAPARYALRPDPAAAVQAPARCTLRPDATVAVYAVEGAGGAGENSVAWTRAFFAWLAAANPSLVVDYVTDAAQVAGYPAAPCALAAQPKLKLWVQPGGSADNQSLALGPGGRDNILDFAASPQGHVMGTCAGFYLFAGTYWWYNDFYAKAWAPHWWPTVEGPLVEVAAYPAYAPVALADGRTVLYWGGPTLGYNNTAAAVPNGGRAVAAYDTSLLDRRRLGAAYAYTGEFVRALFSSAHPEAVAGSGIACQAPLPAGCITAAQQLQNWQWLGGQLGELLGEAFVIPARL